MAADDFLHHVAGFTLSNRTVLGSHRLLTALASAAEDWPVDGMCVWIRYTRGTDYSGTCYIQEGRIFINIGRHLTYPYALVTHVARTRSHRSGWVKPATVLTLDDPYQLAVFIFRHELYHWLVHRAGRNGRQKESMCDRFATRYAVDELGCALTDSQGRPIDRAAWDWQDLDRFVAAARGGSAHRKVRRKASTVPGNRPGAVGGSDQAAALSGPGEQMMLPFAG